MDDWDWAWSGIGRQRGVSTQLRQSRSDLRSMPCLPRRGGDAHSASAASRAAVSLPGRRRSMAKRSAETGLETAPVVAEASSPLPPSSGTLKRLEDLRTALGSCADDHRAQGEGVHSCCTDNRAPWAGRCATLAPATLRAWLLHGQEVRRRLLGQPRRSTCPRPRDRPTDAWERDWRTRSRIFPPSHGLMRDCDVEGFPRGSVVIQGGRHGVIHVVPSPRSGKALQRGRGGGVRLGWCSGQSEREHAVLCRPCAFWRGARRRWEITHVSSRE